MAGSDGRRTTSSLIMRLVEATVKDYGFSPQELDDIWARWRDGESLMNIGRAVDRPLQHVRRTLLQTGGFRPSPRAAAASQLTMAERETISRGLAAEQSMRKIADELGRSPSTVSREVDRHGGREDYRAEQAQQRAEDNRRRPKAAKLVALPTLREVVEQKLRLRWSPDQIARWLALEHPDDAEMQISDETIYRSLFDPRLHAVDRTLTRRLRCGRPMRYPRKPRHASGRGRIKNMLSIRERPAEVADRLVPGHWEGDLLMGRRPSAIATLVERTSRYTLLVALPGGFSADVVTPPLIGGLETIPPHLRRSVTWDRGRELARHHEVTTATGVPVYFCNPKSPWQRPSNENTNGLLRQYLAKTADLRTFSQADLDAIAAELNERPRRVHDYRSCADVWNKLVAP